MHSNPLTQWKSGFSSFDAAVPFDQIKPEHFLPALEEGYQEALKNIESLETSSTPPTFENTIIVLEDVSEFFDFVVGIYFNLFSAEASPELQKLAEHISPKSAALSSHILLSGPLFNRVKTLWDKREQLGLDQESEKLLEKTFKSFARNGALLDSQKKEELRQLDQELSKLSPKFSENVLKATNAFSLEITQPQDLEGLPESAIEAAKDEAKKRGKPDAWIFTLQMPSYLPFMQFAKNRALRETLFRASGSRAVTGELSNQNVILDVVRLREKRAQLLGYENHAAFVLEERMAKSPTNVFKFLNELLEPSKASAQKDLEELKAFASKLDGLTDLKPWDVPYYSEKLKEEKYAFNAEELRPYFALENVIQGVFEHARKLYQIEFTERKDIPKYHPDVVTYEVKDTSTGEYVGLFYADFFPRETKRGGAWMTSFRDQGRNKNKVTRPHISIVCNFTKPTSTRPSLLSYDEVRTLFHEFGHALHGMLSKCTYRSLSGTNVFWDFVELPSQIMENWVAEKEGLDIFAKHYQTHEKIPAPLVEKLKKSQNFQAGSMSLRQINFGLMDMYWHTLPAKEITSVIEFENRVTAPTRLFEPIEGLSSSCTFSHIFAGGYSAGYYSYKWAEVLDADAFEYFLEKGIFNPEVAQKFKENILMRGGVEHPETLYMRFRGRLADPKALLRRDGLLNA